MSRSTEKEISSKDSETAIVFTGGVLNPFDLAIFTLTLCAIFAALLWEENFGQDQSEEDKISDKPKPSCHNFRTALRTIIGSTEILLCGLISSLFEGSMYVFVFMWTPAMEELSKTEGKLRPSDLFIL